MRTLALIPARAGSKGIPGKNLRNFRGKPLVRWATQIGAETCDEAWVTTDSREIMEAALGPHRVWGLWRPDEVAADDTPMLAVIQHALKKYGQGMNPPYDVIVLLQPTQPLRKPEHIKEALRLLEETGADSVVSVVQIPAHYSPDMAMRITLGPQPERLVPFLDPNCECGPCEGADPDCRQFARASFSRDGTVYAIKRQTIEAGSLYGSHCVPLIIPSHESVNLDTEEDWQRAEAMVRK